jgi:hypothetical protein
MNLEGSRSGQAAVERFCDVRLSPEKNVGIPPSQIEGLGLLHPNITNFVFDGS